MNAALRYTLRRLRGQFIGWSVALAAYAFLIASSTTFVQESAKEITQLLDKLPSGIVDFLGTDTKEIATPLGFIHVRYFMMMSLIFGIFGIMTGSGLLSSDEEAGRMDLLMAYPISRRSLFFGRLLGLLLVTVTILIISGVSLALSIKGVGLDLDIRRLPPAMVSLLAVVLVFQTMALLFSMLLPSRSSAGMAAGLVLIGSFILTGLARVNPTLDVIARLLPMSYYQGGEAMIRFHLASVIGFLITSALFTGLAYWRFERRDIRVTGEGTLNWKATVAGAAVVVLLAVAVAWVMTRDTRFRSPETTFAVARRSIEEKDWEQACQALTPEMLDQWTGRMVATGSLLKIDQATQLKGKMPVSVSEIKQLLPLLVEAQLAMAQVDDAKLKPFKALMLKTLLGVEPDPDQLAELAKLVKDRIKFTSRMLKAVSTVKILRTGDKIEDLRVDGDSATAMMTGPGKLRRQIQFRRIDGNWKVALPFPDTSEFKNAPSTGNKE